MGSSVDCDDRYRPRVTGDGVGDVASQSSVVGSGHSEYQVTVSASSGRRVDAARVGIELRLRTEERGKVGFDVLSSDSVNRGE